MSKVELIKDLTENYTKPSHPIAFSGRNAIYNYYDGQLNEKDIDNFLGGNESYTIHRQFKNLKRNPSYARFKRYQFQIDLVDVRDLSESNSNVNFLLNCIDCYTRFAYSRPLLNKSAEATLDGFKSILDESGSFPVTLVADRGRKEK